MTAKKIFIGGYTKSGTAFVGRAFGLFNGVYAKGEMDYFRIFFRGMEKMVVEYNDNIVHVNREVYDGRGTLEGVTINGFREIMDQMFLHIYFSGKPAPADCDVIVEKSPHNIFWVKQIFDVYPSASFLCVYRSPQPVFRSLVRHMTDHRDTEFANPSFERRRKMLTAFQKRWTRYVGIMENYRHKMKIIRYDAAAADNAGLLQFIEQEMLGYSPGLRAPVETLSKEHYLQSLPEAERAKSLVQIGPYKVKLSEEEMAFLSSECREPDISFDF